MTTDSAESSSVLITALSRVKSAIERHLARLAGEVTADLSDLLVDPVSLLGLLVRRFRLTPFERDILVLCAGLEFDGGFAALCDRAQGGVGRPFPTFSLALAALPGAHWSALSPESPLRRWKLIEVGAGQALVYSPLRIAEGVANFLVGVPHLDERLGGIARLLPPDEDPIVPSHLDLAERLQSVPAGSRALARCLVGPDRLAAIAIAQVSATGAARQLLVVTVPALPSGPSETDGVLRLIMREATLHAAQVVLDAYDVEPSEAARVSALRRAVDSVESPIVICRDRLPIEATVFEVHPPARAEQADLWRNLIGDDSLITALTDQFNLSAAAIRSAVARATDEGARSAGVWGSGRVGDPAAALGALTPTLSLAREREQDAPVQPSAFSLQPSTLWDACREQARPGLDDLAQRIEASASWDRLVLPPAQKAILAEITLHVRGRSRVYEDWGFGGHGARGLGISALFAGASGTGKTMAAEVIARELRLDLYRIDLSAVVSKYIGETEKNLRRVFDAAETGGVVLLFDEADALFGKRSEVKDSHDRYANIEVGYLLQRMESYRGLAILTTNLKSALDPAFLRRIRFVVLFPFPDAPSRAEIWRRIFPDQTPRFEIDYDKLARLNVAGGNIRNIALGAAFLAAADGGRVEMSHLLAAARSEYSKIERVLTETEIAGWHA